MSPTLNAGMPLAITLMLPGNAAFAAQCTGTFGHGGCGVTDDINFANSLPLTVILRWPWITAPPPEFISPILTIGLIYIFSNQTMRV